MSEQTSLLLTSDNPLYFFEIAINRPLFQSFTYAFKKDIPMGSRVIVTVGNSTEVGIVIEKHLITPEVDFSINPIDEVIDDTPTVNSEVIEIAKWTSQYFFQPIGELLFTFLPNYLKQAKPLNSLYTEGYLRTNHPQTESLLKNAKKQQEAFNLLNENAPTSKSTLLAQGIKSNTLLELCKKGLIEKTLIPPTPSYTSESNAPLKLNQEQTNAVQAVVEHKDQFGCFLLEGITGSGKTEVYLHICKSFLSVGQQVLLLVPEIGLTSQLAERLESQLNTPVITLHSNLANKERASRWLQTQQSQPMVIIGTRSAVACPLPNLGCIILDEEHDSSFKQQEGIRYHSRSVAIKRAQLRGLPVVLGSATPSLETLTNTYQQRFQHLRLTKRATGARLPKTQIQDASTLNPDQIFTADTLSTIKATLASKQQVLVFINRRGFAPTLQCNQCHWVAECEQCDVALTLHQSTNSMDCHHCEAKHPIPKRCPKCNSPYLSPLGYGTERIEHELIQTFPDFPIIRMDRDSTQNKGSLEKIRNQLLEDSPCILVGTQMVAKGHNFPNLTLTVVLNCDNGLYSQDFRAKETLLQNLIQVGGRSGRADKPGQVIIQTSFVDHPLLKFFEQQDYQGFAKEELTHRKNIGLPPYHHQAAIRMQSLMDNKAFTQLMSLEQALKTYKTNHPGDNVEISLTMPAAIERKSNWYRYLIMLSSPDRKQLHHYLNVAHHFLIQTPRTRKLKWVIDVDPLDTW
ncbi:primosomal protein N' [Litoribrevibacter albus]|uniref:Replication restart protein PriA n=1 Tax=Litoribrevibacter albus TaxID=1473156 RepID=A0AA37SEA3_9GAMM|nr:primosomal protein N' [Litoribrevibacter albus]GLQ33473.1 primosomal protein N' [Litoribrevibacter albus]